MKSATCLVIIFAAVNLVPSWLLAQESDEEQIKSLIPAATAVTHLFDHDPANKCIMRMLVEIRPAEDVEKRKEYEVYPGEGGLGIGPVPFVNEMKRGDHLTYIKADRITKFTCEIGMRGARGVVEWEVPKLVRGRFEYRAVRTDDGWKISEIRMPAYKIRIKQEETGKWKLVEFEDEDE